MQNYSQLECEIFSILLKHVGNHLSVGFQFAWRTFNNHIAELNSFPPYSQVIYNLKGIAIAKLTFIYLNDLL